MKLRRIHAAWALVLSAALLSACSSSASTASAGPSSSAQPAGTAPAGLPALVQKAKQEGSLTLYAAQPPAVLTAAASAFKKQYGITVNVVRLDLGPLRTRFLADAQANTPGADVIMGDPSLMSVAAKYLKPLDEANLPDLAGYPEKVTDNSILFAIQPIVIMYNSSVSIKSWNDLLAPKFKGKIAWITPQTVPPWLSMVNAIYDTPSLGPAYLAKLQAQDIQYVSGSQIAAQGVASGQYLVDLMTTSLTYASLKSAGAPVDLITPDPTTGILTLAGVPLEAQHPDAGLLFTDWLLSPAGQAVYNAGQVSTLRGIPGTVPLPADYAEPDTSIPASLQDRLFSILHAPAQ